MRASLRARRMARHHSRRKGVARLSLVSLMDIFTILVFFLLLNSSDVEVLQNDKSVVLPESTAEQRPGETLVLLVSDTEVLLGGKPLVAVADVMERGDGAIAELAAELQYQAGRAAELSPEERERGRAITIMGDKRIPFALLKRIMATCAENEYRHISLAVNQRDASAPAGVTVEPRES